MKQAWVQYLCFSRRVVTLTSQRCAVPESFLRHWNVGADMHVEASLTFFAHGDHHHAPVQVAGLSEHNGLKIRENVGSTYHAAVVNTE